MKALRWLAVVVPLLVSATEATAALLPSFRLEACSWEATHIVVVSEGDKIDGEVEVLESWKGDLKKGDKLSLPDLAEFAPEKERVVSKSLFDRDKDKVLPATVSCSRVALFLRKSVKAEEGKPAKTTWLPAPDGWGGMKVSVAWIEGDKVFAFAQEFNPGPQKLLSWGLDERGLKTEVDAVVKAQTTLTEAIRKGDADKLTTAVLDLLRSESTFVPHAVVWDLRTAGAKGLPALRTILKEDKLLKYHDGAVRSLAKTGGADVGPELVKLLERELAFWKKVGPKLPADWWSGARGKIEWEEVTRLRDHYSLAHTAVLELGILRHVGGRDAVSAFGEYWKSLPQLLEVKQLAEACDDTLKALPRK